MTVVALGKKPQSGVREVFELRALLEQCHVRIRTYLRIFDAIAGDREVPAREVADAALSVRKYFEQGFPLHAADEDLSVMPRLVRSAPALAAVQAQLQSEHRGHEAVVRDVVRLSTTLYASPHARQRLLPELVRAAERLRAELEPHMVVEEQEVFPLLANISKADEQCILEEMRARREPKKT